MKQRLTPDLQCRNPSNDVEGSTAGARNGQDYAHIPDFLDTFQLAANQWPDQPAVQFRDRVLSYGELHTQSNRIANWLIGRGIRPDDTVALCFDKSQEALIIILGILKSGAACVPLDPHYPASRLAKMVADTV